MAKKNNDFQSQGTLGTLVLVFAIVAVGFASINAYFALSKNSEMNSALAGYAGSEGYVNVTVSTVVSVNFSYDVINWGVGSVDNGQTNASLDTIGPTVSRGNWSATGINPLVLTNIGSVNASVALKSDVIESTFFGGSAGNQRFALNVTNNKTGSCDDPNGYFNDWRNFTTAGNGDTFCNQFGFRTGENEIRIDVLVVVPYDATLTGARNATITATASTAV